MRVLYPLNPLNRREADGSYQEEYRAAMATGLRCSLFDFDEIAFGEFRPKPKIEAGEDVLYRGWMLNLEGYRQLTAGIEQRGGQAVTTVAQYQRCHHLPGWYEQCKAFTAETHFFENDEQLEANISGLDWPSFFVKDFVKSNTAEMGSVAHSPQEAIKIVQQLEQYRGDIEGGVAIRQVENYISDSERRYFIVQGKPFSCDEDIPEVVHSVASIIQAPFFSVDVIQQVGGGWRLVELGDGQVSDRKAWPLDQFMDVIQSISMN